MNLSQKRTAFENPSSLIYERKFDVAIRDSFYDKFKSQNQYYQNLYEVPKELKYDYFIEDHIKVLYSDTNPLKTPEHYARFLTKIMRAPRLLSGYSKSITKLKSIPSLINSVIEIQIRYAHEKNYLINKPILLQKYNHWRLQQDIPFVILNLLLISRELGLMIDASNRMFNPKFKHLPKEEFVKEMNTICKYRIDSLNVTFHWSESVCYISLDGQIYMQPRAVLLMYHNKICDLISVLTYSHYSSGNSLPREGYDVTINFIKCMCEILIKYKNQGFSIFKVLEGLITAETLVDSEEWINNEFLENISNDLYNKTKFDYFGSKLRDIIREADIPFRHDLGCCSKLLGHPLVSIKAGSVSLHKKVTEDLKINMSKVYQCVNYCKRDYIKKYIQKCKKWPPCEILPATAPECLRMAQVFGKDPDSLWIRNKYGRVDILYYEFVELLPSIEFNKLENIVPLLKDKTVSLLRSEVMAKYMNNVKPKQEWENTRLLITYLINPSMVHDHLKFLDKYINSTDFNNLLNYLIIRIVPKEKEMKIDFRGFGCQTYETRYKSIVQEKNVSIFLGEYSDEQTLTSSELDIIKKLDAFRRITKAYTRHRALYIVIDASAWNNRFSNRTVDDFGRETLDKIFNVSLFSKTHKAFEKTLIYVPDGNDIYYWEGQRGGIEGLAQYTWMTVYINQMRVALEGFPFKYHILCKGDDMRIVVLIPEHDYDLEEYKSLKNEIVETISTTSKEFGHQINIEESYGSCHYFAFSKNASLDTTELPQTFRKIQKAYGANNAFINTLDDYIAATFSNGHSACKVSPTVLPCYCVSLLWFYYYILDHTLFQKCTTDQLVALSLIPSIVGGFPIIYLHNFHVRAESDLLAPFLDIYNFCSRFFPLVADVMSNFFYIQEEIPKTIITICQDPYSLVLSRPMLPSSILKSAVTPKLKRITRNNDLKMLINLATSKEQEIIVEALSSCNIIRAKPLANLYSATPKALFEEQIRKFASGKSILDLLLLKTSRFRVNKILINVLKAENRVQNWRYTRIMGRGFKSDRCFRHLITECPAQSAYEIRKFCYGKPVEDVTMPPIQHQISLHHDSPSYYDEWISHHHFNYTIEGSMSTITRDNRLQYGTGPFTPFLGYTTRSGQTAPLIHFIEKDDTLRKVKTLLDLVSWLNISLIDNDGVEIISNSSLLIKQLLKLYTDTPLENLVPFCRVRKSGTAQHHMRSPSFRESIVPNTLSNIYCMVKGESSSHVALQSSSQHFRINFLHCYCHVIWLLFSELEFSQDILTPRQVWAVTTECDFCNTPILEQPLLFNEMLINLIDLPQIRFTKLNEIAENILRKSLNEFNDLTPNLPREDHQITYDIACHGVLQHMIDNHYVSRKSLQERYTQHAYSEEGKHIMSIISGSGIDRDVGLTEAKSISTDRIYNALLLSINYILTTDMRTLDNFSLQEWILYTPVEQLAWYPIVNWLHLAGKLPNLIRLCYRQSNIPPGSSYYNPGLASKYLGLVALKGYEGGIIYLDLVYLSHYQESHLDIYLRIMVQNLAVYNVRLNYDRRYLEGISQNSEQHVKDAAIILLFSNLIVFSMFIKGDEEYLLLAQRIKTKEDNRIQVVNLHDIQQQRAEITLAELRHSTTLSKYIGELISKLLDTCNFLSYDDLLDFLFDNYYNRAHDYIINRVARYECSISVSFTSLTECISVVRSHRADNINEDIMDDLTLERLINNEDIIDRHDYNHPNPELDYTLSCKVTTRLTLLNADSQNHRINVIDPSIFSTNEFINLAYFYNVFGQGNNSCNHLIDIFESVTNDNYWEQPKRAFVCYDGLGGATSVLNLKLVDSEIFFHTHPDEQVFSPEPESALENPRNNNQLFYHYLAEGYYDLSHDHVCDLYLRMLKHLDIMISDLEYKDVFDGKYERILYSIVRIYILIGGSHSMLILKLDLRNYKTIVKIIYLLRRHTASVDLIVPKSEVCSFVCYVVSTKVIMEAVDIKNYYINYDEIPQCADTSHRLNQHIRRSNTFWRDQAVASFTRVITLTPCTTRHSQLFSASLGRLYYTRIFIDYSTTISEVDHVAVTENFWTGNDMRDISNFRAWVTEHDVTMVVITERLSRSLRKNDNPKYSKQTWDPDTASHRRAILAIIFKLYGFQEIINNTTRVHPTATIDFATTWISFSKYIQRWEGRDIPKNSQFRLGSHMEDNSFPRSLLLDYCRGANNALILLGGLLNHNIRRRRHEQHVEDQHNY